VIHRQTGNFVLSLSRDGDDTYVEELKMSNNESLYHQTADRLGSKYGEVLDVSAIAHLFGKNEARVRRWMIDSASGRTLRKHGVKIGRRVCWPVLVVAKYVLSSGNRRK
jgi:hypothetical protein